MIATRTDPEQPDPVVLLSVIGRILGRKMADLLAPIGLKTRHMQTLMTLRRTPLSQQDLAERLGAHPTKLVALLNDLEADGLVVRARDAVDRRRHTVTLSKLGVTRLKAVDVALRELEAALFNGIAPADRARLRTLLAVVVGNLGTSPCASEDDVCGAE